MAKDQLTYEEVAKRVKTYLVEEQSVEAEKITSSASFSKDFEFDSLDLLELVMDLEDKFKIGIPDEVAEKIQTVGQATEYIFSVVNSEK